MNFWTMINVSFFDSPSTNIQNLSKPSESWEDKHKMNVIYVLGHMC